MLPYTRSKTTNRNVLWKRLSLKNSCQSWKNNWAFAQREGALTFERPDSITDNGSSSRPPPGRRRRRGNGKHLVFG